MIDAAALLTMANMVRENVIHDSRDFFMVIFRQFRTELIIVLDNSTYRSGAGGAELLWKIRILTAMA